MQRKLLEKGERGWLWTTVPCPKCKRGPGYWCGPGDDGSVRGNNPPCEVRIRLWNCLGRPQVSEKVEVPLLVQRMLEATLDE